MKVFLGVLIAFTSFLAGALGGGFVGLAGGGAAGALVGTVGGACSVLQDAEKKGLLSSLDAASLFNALQDRLIALSKNGDASKRITFQECEDKLDEFRKKLAE